MPPTPDHVGRLLARLLGSHGVEVIFGLPGGQTAALYDAVHTSGGRLRHVLVRDERSGAYAADAYARVTGRVGVCDATVGPGTAKLPSGLGEALNSSVPVLALVSELPRSSEARRHRGATSQALDQEALLAPVTKWCATVRRQEDLAPLVRRAFREATTGRPGPVAVVLPQDVLDEAAAVDEVVDRHAERFGRHPALRLLPDPADVERVVDLLRTAARPLLVLGGGARWSGAGEAAVQVAEAAGAALATTISGKGSVDEAHPLAVGVLGTMGSAAASEAAERADLLVLVGTKLGSGTSLGWTLPKSGQLVAQIDIDPAELGRDVPLDALLLADAGLAMEALAERVGPGRVQGDWTDRVARFREDWRGVRDAERASDDTPVRPQRVMGELEHLLEPTDVVVADASLSSGWVAAYLEVGALAPRTLFPRGLAGLGWSIPAAIGVSVALPEARVVTVLGDGAAGYAVGELATFVQHGLRVKMVVLNNSSLGWIRWYRRVSFGRGWEEPDTPRVEFARVARAYGIPAQSVAHPADLPAALEELLGAEGPGMVEVVSSVWDTPLSAHRAALEAGEDASYGS